MTKLEVCSKNYVFMFILLNVLSRQKTNKMAGTSVPEMTVKCDSYLIAEAEKHM